MVKVRKVGKENFVEFKVKYNPEFLAELKERLTPRERRWDPIKKVWLIREDKVGVMKELLKKYFG